MNPELKKLASKLSSVTHPEDVFGVHKGTDVFVKTCAQKEYRRLAKISHPDKNPDEKILSDKTFLRLTQLWETAELKFSQGTYGLRKPVEAKPATSLPVFRTKKYTYTIMERLYTGGTAGIFHATAVDRSNGTARILVKVPHVAKDNDLMEREAVALKLVAKKLKESSLSDAVTKMAARIPTLLESFSLDDGGTKKTVNVFTELSGLNTGWFSLEEIRRRHPEGVSTRVMVFIWNRLLEGLTLAHLSGVIHGAVTPNHVMIHAGDHLGKLVDWTSSCRLGQSERVPYLDERYRAYFPPEIISSLPPGPSSDIFMSAWCMVYLLGGDPSAAYVPDTVEEPIHDFFNLCLQPNRSRRPRSAEEAYTEFRRISKDLFGPRKFVELAMPVA